MQVVEVMAWAEKTGSEQVMRKCLALMDKNVMQVDREEVSILKGKSGVKWKRLQRAQPGEKRQSNRDNKENLNMKSLKRGSWNEVEAQQVEVTGKEKRQKVQADQNKLYNVQVGVASLEWPQMIQ